MEIDGDIFNTELGRKIMALIKASFRVSDLIPDLVLRERIKHQSLEVYKASFLALKMGKNYSEIVREIDILDNYFYLGGHLNLIKEEHLKQLRNGFLVFKSHIILTMNKNVKLNADSQTTQPADDRKERAQSENLNDKQKKIMEKFESKDTLKLAEILEVFPDFSERTIRNELSSLISLGKITRNGKGNGSFYKLLR